MRGEERMRRRRRRCRAKDAVLTKKVAAAVTSRVGVGVGVGVIGAGVGVGVGVARLVEGGRIVGIGIKGNSRVAGAVIHRGVETSARRAKEGERIERVIENFCSDL